MTKLSSKITKITYIITDGTALKIGRTMFHTIKRRISKLQIGNPRKIRLLGGFISDVENELHLLLNKYLIHGEWFTFKAFDVIWERDDFLFYNDFIREINEMNIHVHYEEGML